MPIINRLSFYFFFDSTDSVISDGKIGTSEAQFMVLHIEASMGTIFVTCSKFILLINQLTLSKL